MLLLVVPAELEQGCGFMPRGLAGGGDKARHRGANMVAISADDIDRRARQHAALGSRMARADRLVIGIEQIGEGRVEHPVVRVEPSEDKCLEEPCRVRQMPFRRAGVGHRLDRLVLGRQIGGQRLGVLPHGFEPVECDLPIGVVGLLLRGVVEHERPPGYAIVPINTAVSASLPAPR